MASPGIYTIGSIRAALYTDLFAKALDTMGEQLPCELAVRILHRLRVLCRHLQYLPSAFVLPSSIALDAGALSGYGGFSEVQRGQLGRITVAVKSLRIHPDELDAIKKVRNGQLPPHHDGPFMSKMCYSRHITPKQ